MKQRPSFFLKALGIIGVTGCLLFFLLKEDSGAEKTERSESRKPYQGQATKTQQLQATSSRIKKVKTSEDAASHHLVLTQLLISTLLELADESDKGIIESKITPISLGYEALERRVTQLGLEKPGKHSVPFDENYDYIEHILALWDHNSILANTVDGIFRNQNILNHRTVAESLSRWINKTD